MNSERRRKIKWEVFSDSEKKEEYKESMRVKWNEKIERGTGESYRMQWNQTLEMKTEAAEEVCVLENGQVANL